MRNALPLSKVRVLREKSNRVRNVLIPDGSGSEDLASNIDLTDAINRFLRSLPIEQRRVFIKRYWYMSSITDTATSFGMSESKVTSILFRVRNKLKEHLTKEGFDL